MDDTLDRPAMIAGPRGERGPPDSRHPAAAGPDRRDRRARHHRRDRQGRGAAAGPPRARIRQPYYDLAKLFRKEALAPEGASWFFLAAPLIAVAAYLTIPLLIPVLTSYGLPLGYMGDILGGGFLLSLASFVVATAALETGSPYAQLGSSRAKTFSAITEPVVLFVVFTVALLTGTDLPYALAATVRSQRRADHPPGAPAGRGRAVHGDPARDRPDPGGDAHRHQRVRHDRGSPGVRALRPVLRAAEVGQRAEAADPVHDPGRRVPRARGAWRPPSALGAIVLAIAALLAKASAVGCVVAVIDNSFAKLRLFKITEFVSGAFLLAVLGVFTLYLGGG